MTVPEALATALASLPDDPRVVVLEGWADHGGSAWSFRFHARLSTPASDYMPEWSTWRLVARPLPSKIDVDVLPDASDGITATFPHQAYNAAPEEGAMWRTGKPCLERPIAAFKRADWGGEPRELDSRIIWRIGRLLEWIDDAASDQLLRDGDPIELPVLPLSTPHVTIGFSEAVGEVAWGDQPHRWGFATLAHVPGARPGVAVVRDLMAPDRTLLRRMAWSRSLSAPDGRIDAVWLLLPQFVVGAPWSLATTWKELSHFCTQVGVDLPAIVAEAGAKLRRFERPKQPHPCRLLIGFPMSEKMGDDPGRPHWLAAGNLRTARREAVRRGFSDLAGARKRWDREVAQEARQIEWIATANWAPDQLRRRGEAESALRAKSVLILGGGALGGAIAENLLRTGVTRLGVVDGDHVAAGNLSRHVLAMRDVGWNKATALAERLNGLLPDGRAEALPFSFPPDAEADRARLKGWDVIVDCTADDDVLHNMATYPWDGEKLFISLAMTWEAKGLFVYVASEATFPALDAIERFHQASPAPDEDNLSDMEGIGCWHPVFPAAADDVQLWAALGVKVLRRAVADPARRCELFVQTPDGAIERHAVGN